MHGNQLNHLPLYPKKIGRSCFGTRTFTEMCALKRDRGLGVGGCVPGGEAAWSFSFIFDARGAGSGTYVSCKPRPGLVSRRGISY